MHYTPRPPRSCRWKIRLFNYKQGLTEGILGVMGGGWRVRDIWAFYRRLLQTAYAGIFSEPSSFFWHAGAFWAPTQYEAAECGWYHLPAFAAQPMKEEEATNSTAILLFSICTYMQMRNMATNCWLLTVCLCHSLPSCLWCRRSPQNANSEFVVWRQLLKAEWKKRLFRGFIWLNKLCWK